MLFPRFRNSENVGVLLRHGLSFPRFENYQNVKDPPTEHEFRSVLLGEVFLSRPELSNAITIQHGKRADCVELPSAVSCNSMQVIRDCFGHLVRFSDERVAHILEHAEMAGMHGEIERVLQAPTEVRVSRADDNVRLFYEFYA